MAAFVVRGGREGGKDILSQNKAELLITKCTNMLTIRKCWLFSLHMGVQTVNIWGNNLNSEMVSLLEMSSPWCSE